MALNYDNFRALATRLISQNGVGAVLSRETDGAYDPITDTGTPVIDMWPGDVVLLRLRSGDDDFDWQTYTATYEINRISKALISGGRLPANIGPEPGDTLTIAGSGDIWTVLGNNPTRPDDSEVLHTCIVVRGASYGPQ